MNESIVSEPKEVYSLQEALVFVSNTTLMKEYYKDFSTMTAKGILEALPKAWESHSLEGGRWGPGIIANSYTPKAGTIGRYNSAFKKAGIKKIIGPSGEEIPIP